MFFGLKFVWVHHLCGFCAGVAVSFTFDCFSILARVLEKKKIIDSFPANISLTWRRLFPLDYSVGNIYLVSRVCDHVKDSVSASPRGKRLRTYR